CKATLILVGARSNSHLPPMTRFLLHHKYRTKKPKDALKMAKPFFSSQWIGPPLNTSGCILQDCSTIEDDPGPPRGC
ncbi:Hypothetical predicted protein, partial [Olea europaea subsp. europaea]